MANLANLQKGKKSSTMSFTALVYANASVSTLSASYMCTDDIRVAPKLDNAAPYGAINSTELTMVHNQLN